MESSQYSHNSMEEKDKKIDLIQLLENQLLKAKHSRELTESDILYIEKNIRDYKNQYDDISYSTLEKKIGYILRKKFQVKEDIHHNEKIEIDSTILESIFDKANIVKERIKDAFDINEINLSEKAEYQKQLGEALNRINVNNIYDTFVILSDIEQIISFESENTKKEKIKKRNNKMYWKSNKRR